MLSTRAGGLGLNLAVADTAIIYDSDWVSSQLQTIIVFLEMCTWALIVKCDDNML